MKVNSNTVLKKIIGLLLILIAVIGVLVSLGGVTVIWRMKGVVSAEIVSTMDELIDTMTTTEQGIGKLSSTLDTGLESIEQLDKSLLSARATLETTDHFFDTAAVLTGKTLPDTFTSVQTAFKSASQSAKFVDDSLNFMSSLPLIGGNYTPTVPLSEAMGQVAKDLEPLPGTFKGIEDDVLEVKGDLQKFQTQLDEAHAQVQRVQESANGARQMVTQAQSLTASFSPRLQAWREKLPRWINLASWGLIIFLTWVALAQSGLLIQGLSLVFPSNKSTPTEIADKPVRVEEAGGDFGDSGPRG